MLREGLLCLAEDAGDYIELLKQDPVIRVGISLIDSREEATLLLGTEINVLNSIDDVDIIFTMESKVFESILERKADFAALIGRSYLTESRPINFKLVRQEKAVKIMEASKALMTIFFTPGKFKSKKLVLELSGQAHGAHTIPLIYYNDLRVAWYNIRKGEVLNEAGERDPYPQAFIILDGEGTLILNYEEIIVTRGCIYYIPPYVTHKIKTENEITLLWLAWKTPR